MRLDPAVVDLVVEPLAHGVDLGVVDRLGCAEQLAARLPELVGVCAEEHLSVGAVEQLVRPHPGVFVARRRGDGPVDGVVDDGGLGQGEDAVDLGDVDELPLAGALRRDAARRGCR